MNKIIKTGIFALTTLAAANSYAAELVFENAYAGATVPGMKVSSAYFTAKNPSKEDVVIVSAKTTVANITELHLGLIENDKMVMRKQDQIVVKAGDSVKFDHHGYHIMFMDLKDKLRVGETVTLDINYADGTSQTLQMPVKATTKTTKHAHHHHDDGAGKHEHAKEAAPAADEAGKAANEAGAPTGEHHHHGDSK